MRISLRFLLLAEFYFVFCLIMIVKTLDNNMESCCISWESNTVINTDKDYAESDSDTKTWPVNRAFSRKPSKNKKHQYQSHHAPIEEAFVSFATSSYFPLMEVLVASVHAFSTRPIVVYGINTDVPFDTNKYPRLIKRRINKKIKFHAAIYFEKLHIILDSNVKYGIYVEADDIVNYKIDDLFSKCRTIGRYPLSPIHPDQKERRLKAMKLLKVSRQTNPYVHAHILFSPASIPFIRECYRNCLRLGSRIGDSWDEALLNVMLWKNNVRGYYLPIFDPYYVAIDDYIRGITKPDVTYHMFHGCKGVSQAWNVLELLKQNVGNPIN